MPAIAHRFLFAISWLLTTVLAQQPGERTDQPAPAERAAPSDDPAYEALLARLAERPGDVAAALARIPSPAARARLQAAFGPSEQRPMAMLGVARMFPDDPEADLALLAAAAALVQYEGRGEAVPELDLWHAETAGFRPMGNRAQASLLPTLLALHREVAARRVRGGDPAALDEASALLRVASVSRSAGTVWLRSDARFETPDDLREPIELAWYRRERAGSPTASTDLDWLHWHELLALGDPRQRTRLEPQQTACSALVPTGRYLLAVRSLSTPWWAVQPIEVSDLEAVAVLEEQALVLAAWDEDRPLAARFELAARHGQLRGAVEGHGTVIPIEPGVGVPDTSFELEVTSDAGPARLSGATGPPPERAVADGYCVHIMVERPVYRPGETVRARLILRRCRYDGRGRAAIPTTEAATASDVRVHASFGDAGTVAVAGRTDEHGLFSFEFEIPETADPTYGVNLQVDVPELDESGKTLQIAGGRPFAVAHFERTATTLVCTGPEFLPEPDENDHVEITAQVCYASGAPVEGQLVQALLEGSTTSLRTGPDGSATLRIDLDDWRTWWLRKAARADAPSVLTVQFRAVGPDGKHQVASHTLRRRGSTNAPPAASWQHPWSEHHDEPRIGVEPSVVGRPTRIVVRGRPGARAMLVVGRSLHARAYTLQFDEQGRAARTIDVQRSDWPSLDVALVDRDTLVRDHADVTLGNVVPVVVEAPASATPGQEIVANVRTGRPGALVTLAVVDERVFAIETDRTRKPTEALRPAVPDADWQFLHRAPRSEARDVLAGMLENGRVPPLDETSFGPAGGAGMGGPGAGNVAEPLRADFRSAAHFATQVADALGLATFSFRLPSDLTTWRLTAVVVDDNGEGTIATAATATRLPWSVEPVLPRAVREGDTFALPLVVARDAEATATTVPISVEIAAPSEPSLLEVLQPPAALVVPQGSSRILAVPMRSLGSGAGRLDLALRADTLLDRSQRALPIARDAVARPVVVAQRGAGVVRVPLPEGASADEPMLVDVMLGDAAVWSRLEQDLAVYPYGCAEQTLSKLLPYFAAVRASVRRSAPIPAMDQAFRRRMRGGLGRLRQLRVGEQFAFWPGGTADPEISVLVKHGLAVLREAGVDLAGEGLDVAGTFVVPARWTNGATAEERAGFVSAIEAAAATLRLAPDLGRAQQLAAVAVPEHAGQRAVVAGLPPGTTARLGLALLAAGAHTEARACLFRLDQPAPAEPGFVPGAGDDPLAAQAMRLELRLALDSDRAMLDRSIADLVLQCAAQRGSTYGQGCAAAALALAVPPAAALEGPLEVVVEVGDERRTLHLDGPRPELGRIRLPRSSAVVVRGPAETMLLVRVTTARVQRGSAHAAWSAPLTVERTLHTLPISVGETSWERVLHQRTDGALPIPDGPLPAGRPILLVVRTTSPSRLRHVVVECPLPCGFEVLAAPPGVERFAEHVAFVADLFAGRTFEQRLVLVPTTVGRFAWPPTTAAPMYAAGLDGGSAGAFVTVVDPTRGNEPSVADWQAPTLVREPSAVRQPRVVSPWEPTHAATDDDDTIPAIDELRRCWLRQEDAPSDRSDLARATVEALGFDPENTNPWHAIARLDHWLVEARFHPWQGGIAEQALEEPFRCWLVELQLDAIDQAIRTPLPEDGEVATAQVHAADRALEQVDDVEDRLRRRIALLRRASTGAPELVATVLGGIPEDPELAEDWPGYLELLHLALVDQDAAARRLALDRLSLARQEALPVAVLLRARGEDWDEEFVQRLVRSERQGSEFLVALQDPDLVFSQADLLRDLLPDEWWPRLPLRVFERLAEVACPDSRPDQWNVPQLASFVARGACADAELVQAFARTDDDVFRAVLVHALRRRGVHDLGEKARPDDASFAAWAAAASLADGDLDGAVALLRSHCDEDGELPQHEPLASIAHFLRWLVAEQGTPQQVYAVVRAMDETTWERIWERMTSDERMLLVDRFRRRIPEQFLPRTAQEAEAIWRFLLRSGNVDAMAQLTATRDGERCARRHVEAGDGGAMAAELREAFADALDLDVDTLQAPVQSEGDSVLQAQRRAGRAAELTARGRAWLERLRRQLGATAPVR